MLKRGKRFREAAALMDDGAEYQPNEAVSIAKKGATAKFAETVELHLRTGSDPRHADQLVRGVVTLPYGTGKPVRVVVFTQGEGVAIAKDAKADYIGDEELMKRIEGGWTDFDVSIATPDMMGKVGRLGRILGRRGLMPNPRTGTVVPLGDIARVVQESKKGRVEYRLDKSALIHVPIGKSDFEETQLLGNLTAVMDNIMRSRPSGIKGQYIRSAFLSSTMGPSIKMDVAAATALRIE